MTTKLSKPARRRISAKIGVLRRENVKPDQAVAMAHSMEESGRLGERGEYRHSEKRMMSRKAVRAMHRIALLVLLLAPLSWAQAPATGDITAGTTCATTGACVSISLIERRSTVAVKITGPFTATLQFEATVDGSTWDAITGDPQSTGAGVSSTTTTGAWVFSVAGRSGFRVRASAYTNGTASVTIRPSDATAKTRRFSDLTVSSLSASQAVETDASKTLVSNPTTGTGSTVRATGPTLSNPIVSSLSAGQVVVPNASKTLSGDSNLTFDFTAHQLTLGVAPILSSLSAGQVVGTNSSNQLASVPIRYCDQFAGADAGAKITACIADLPATGGTADASGIVGSKSSAATITIPAQVKLILSPSLTLASAQNPAITYSGNNAELAGNRAIISYTGTGRAVNIQNVKRTYTHDLVINGPGTGGSTVCLQVGIGSGGSNATTSFNAIQNVEPNFCNKGVAIDGYAANGTYHNTFINVHPGWGNGNNWGWYIIPTTADYANSNTFVDARAFNSASDGWKIDGSNGGTCTGCGAEGNGGYGFNFSGTQTTRNWTFTGTWGETNTSGDFNSGSGTNVTQIKVLGGILASNTKLAGTWTGDGNEFHIQEFGSNYIARLYGQLLVQGAGGSKNFLDVLNTAPSSDILARLRCTGCGAGSYYIEAVDTDGTLKFRVRGDGKVVIANSGTIMGNALELPHIVNKTASANVRNSHDAEATSQSTVYVKVKTITLTHGLVGAARFLFDLKTSNVLNTANARIYRNGVALGTEQSDVTGVYATKSEDLTVPTTSAWNPGDTVELWVKIDNAAQTVSVRNFRIAYDDLPTVTVASANS